MARRIRLQANGSHTTQRKTRISSEKQSSIGGQLYGSAISQLKASHFTLSRLLCQITFLRHLYPSVPRSVQPIPLTLSSIGSLESQSTSRI